MAARRLWRRTTAAWLLCLAAVIVVIAFGVVIDDNDGESGDAGESGAAAERTATTKPIESTAQVVTTSAAPAPTTDLANEDATRDGSTVAGDRFLETFDGAPDTPTPWSSSGWNLTVHSRDVTTFDALDPMDAAHGPDCAAPPGTHDVTAYESSIFQCRDHIMTAINAGGYGMIYLTPARMVDFSEGIASIQFDVSTLRTSVRDWWDVWITPYDDNLQLPLDLGSDVDVAGPPRNAVHVTLGTENQLKAEILSNFEAVQFPGWPQELVTGDVTTGYETLLEPDAARRDTFEIEISRNHLRVGMPAYQFYWIDSDIPNLEWERAIVQFGHHSYNPTKDCGTTNNPIPPVAACAPNTWHWDNIQIEPSVPFTIIASDRRAATASAPTLRLTRAAPSNAHVRFSGIGSEMEIRFDDGEWQPALPQATQHATAIEHFASYWQPIPEGTAAITIRGGDWYGNPWQVRDLSVWSPVG